ncbi:hypothetical protein OCU04_005224 [Sclerotinia nivalis]|uniref:Uncharacterized protein n=1 Tax=Sclerotinia nivalis TaxID=352851 RepID=A0A9X0AS50_9HELO|nr:hypothetical protein OCU04_005224 [Sclerotinia nivalis]
MRPYKSIYDEILAKATSSQYGYTDEQVKSVLEEMHQRYVSCFGNVESSYKAWLVEDWIWICLFPKEHRPHLLSDDTREEAECKLTLVRYAAFMGCAANDSAPVLCNRSYEGEANLVAAQQWESDTVVDTGSEMEAEPTLASNDNFQRKRSMPINEGARKKVKTEKSM